jgi:uncharacterized protein
LSAVRRYSIVTFFVLAYALAWGFVPFGSFGAFAPLLAALIVIPLTQGLSGLRELGFRMIRWRVGWIWWVLAIGVPLGVHLVNAGLNVAAGAGVPSLAFGSLSTFLLMFAVRMVNPTDGPLGEEPGWRGFALPGLQNTLSPLAATMILAVLITGWHLPLFFLEEGGLQPPILVGGLLTTVAVTFWYTWLFNRTGGSVLMTLVAHNIEGSIQAQGWTYMCVWLAVAIGLVVFDWQYWRGPAPAPATFQPAYEGESRVR